MVVDETGNHCFLLCDKAIIYNSWKSDICFKFELKEEIFEVPEDLKKVLTFKSLAINLFDDDVPVHGNSAQEFVFEMLIGTSTGHILHGCFHVR